MPEPRTFADLLQVILKSIAQARNEPTTEFPEDPQVLHRAFYRLQKRYVQEFAVLGDLHFITAGAFPYSPELTEALDLLQMSGAVSRQNPSYERFSPTSRIDTKKVLAKEKKAIIAGDPKRGKALDDLVKELDKELVTPT